MTNNINIRNTGVLNFLRNNTGKERCGLIFGEIEDGEIRIIRLIETPNSSPNPKAHFYITKYNVERAIRQTKLKPLGYFHTHTEKDDANPSQNDVTQMKKYPRLIGMIYHPSTGTVVYFNGNGYLAEEAIW